MLNNDNNKCVISIPIRRRKISFNTRLPCDNYYPTMDNGLTNAAKMNSVLIGVLREGISSML